MMPRPLLSLVLLSALALSPVASAAATDAEVAAHEVALTVAGAFQNDGFRLRDGVWSGKLTAGKSVVIQVNLYAGNEYWFVLGAVAPAKKVAVTIFDETGQPIDCEPYTSEPGEAVSAGAGFSPGVSGPYYVKIALLEGDAAGFCLLYSYK